MPIIDPQVSDSVSLDLEQIINASQKLPAYPSLTTVEQLIAREKRGNCVPVYVELPADLITPCMAYLRIAKDSKYSFLLESVIGGENVARYSFIGAGQLSGNSSGLFWLISYISRPVQTD